MNSVPIESDRLMDDLAEDVFLMFEDMGYDDTHIEAQRLALVGKNKYEILLWCNDLPSKCKYSLADRLLVSEDELNTALWFISLL